MTVRCKNKILQNSQNYFTYYGIGLCYCQIVENLVHYLAYIGKKMYLCKRILNMSKG